MVKCCQRAQPKRFVCYRNNANECSPPSFPYTPRAIAPMTDCTGLEHDSSSDEDDDDDDDGGDDGDEDDDDDDDGDDDGNDRDAQDGGGGSAGQDTETERRSHKRCG